MNKFFNIIHSVLKISIVLIFVAMVAVNFANVIGRYIFLTAFPWADEVSSFAIVWLSFLAIVAGLREDIHPSFDVLVLKLGPAPRKLLLTLINLGILVFIAFITVGGYNYAVRAAIQKTAILKISYSWIYVAVPISGVLMALDIVGKIHRLWTGNKQQTNETNSTVAEVR